MTARRLSSTMVLLGLIATGLRPAASVFAQAPKKIDFAHDIVPLLKARCGECHTNGKYKGGLSFDTREALLKSKTVVPGKAAAGELLRRITSTDQSERMPPKGPPLSPKEIALVRAWIEQGLPWEAGFTFKIETYKAPLAPRRPELPPARPGLEHPIDRLLAVYFEKNKVAPPEAVDDAGFVRRAYLDLIGLLPAPEETEAFLKDAAPDKHARLVRRLLDEPRAYADHWLTFWNDLLRNDYAGTGYIDGGRKQISAWLYRSLAENKPYDRFVRELIHPSAESEGFIRGIKWRGNVNASQVVELQFSQNISQVFFGANLKCASCHDSFIDHWKLDDAYALAAVTAERPLEIHRCDKATGRFAAPGFLWPSLGTIDPKAPRQTRLARLAELATHKDNGRFTRTIANRLWQRLFGRGLVHPVDVMAGRPWSEDLLDHLATRLIDDGYDLKKLLEHITTARAYRLQPAVWSREPAASEYVFRGPELRRLQAEQFVDAVWQVTRTAPGKAAAPVPPAPFGKDVPEARRFVRASLMKSDLLMRSLGRPNREQVVTTRPDQLTTLQALDLANGQILAATLDRGAGVLVKSSGKAGDALIDDLYRRALCRPPTREERTIARDILGSPPTREGAADLLWTVFMLPEFQLIR